MVTPCSSVEGRPSLRSAYDRKYVIPGTRLVLARRSFTVAGGVGAATNSRQLLDSIEYILP